MKNPTPEQIRQVRESLSLTQTEAAALVYRTLSAWQRWEYGERKMPLGTWELFKHQINTEKRAQK